MLHRLALIGFFSVFLGIANAAAFDEVNRSFLGDLAVDGYDSTAYFEKNAPREGADEYTFDYKGATWRFADAKSRDLFAASPDAYAPQYGGYCSNQMSLGNLSDIDPGVWLIYEDKLYLFGHDAGRQRWQQTGIAERIRDADRNWLAYLAGK
ncbi:MAG: YHS domain-containing (seleno)protein [Sneathiella sp.]